ncbi:AN1-type zinc finger protein 4-like [Mizuhopecten yessoensis]|uniref:AN1-type zinc finger protein 4 n=1 Tax=Mizuhopecten yessoensis TaxID=6573 RepID=A0A210PN22_MIZYE|nr:AN1-type zinc finger protein 4-like [Mizuhopecten yessoensis]OWF37826.1 AN1-type zinc finger protein 4 [Mizuhopecten yessoensis]
MELYIETLTGTFFELRVSPFETIMSVKAKIQRLEGIPIAQQHLIWQSMELEDEYSLHDYSINDGATLKLVLAMRGGPINTRRIPMEDPTLREMAEYVEANRDEIWEKVPGNRQVTLLVFREGDQLNFFRVVDRGDGTLTPLSESLSGASMYNFNDEEEEDDVPPKEKLEENEQLKEKMKQLRGKMEKLTLTKKPRKKPHPPTSGHSTGRAATRYRQLPSSGRNLPVGHHLNRKSCLPPVGHTLASPFSPEERLSLASIGGKDSFASIKSSDNDISTIDINSTNSKSPHSMRHLDSAEGGTKLSRTLESVKEDIGTSSEHNTARKTKIDSLEAAKCDEKDRSLSSPPKESSPKLSDLAASSSISHESQKSDYLGAETKDLQRLGHVGNAQECSSRPITSSKMKDLAMESFKDSLRPPTSSKNKQKLKGGDLTIESLKEVLGRPTTSSRDLTLESLQETFGRPTTSSRYKGLERRKEITLESLSTSEARAMSGLLRQASLEKIGSSRIGNIGNFVPSGSKSRLSNYTFGSPALPDGRITTPEGRLVSARLQRVTNSRDGRLLSPSHRLPPVKPKKKVTKRCFVCGKKTGLATSYICRCGNNFCATHRYAESHECTFDYKTEGRKLLEQSNPVVSAPKLPKI